MHLNREEVYHSPATSNAEYYHNHSEASETSNSSTQKSFKESEVNDSIGNPWNWQLKNVKPKYIFKETQYETNQKKTVHYQNNSYTCNNQKFLKKDDYLYEKRMIKRLPPKYGHIHFDSLQKLKADPAVEKHQNTFFANETLHGYSNADRENREQMLKLTDVNYPIKSKIGSLQHKKVVNVKTKSVVSFHRNDSDRSNSSYDLQCNYKVESNSISTNFSSPKDQRLISTSVQSIHQMQLNESDALSHSNVNDRTLLEKDVHIYPNRNSDSNVTEFIVETEQGTSDSTKRTQCSTSSNSHYSDSCES